jgi:tRNA(Ile)-lysidine synthase
VVLLHLLKSLEPRYRYTLSAVHVHHGLSPNAHAWAAFCRRLCKQYRIPLTVRRVKVVKAGKGLEAAARAVRYEVFRELKTDCVALAHHLDDQAETVLMNLLRGAGLRGASGMSSKGKLQGKTVLRPLLGVSRASILAYANRHKLEWIEDESNLDESLTRNFVRLSVGPLLEKKFPRWKESLARAAKVFSRKEAGGEELLRKFLATHGLRAPSEAKLVEMLKQLASAGARTLIEHDGAQIRTYRGKVLVQPKGEDVEFAPIVWSGEARVRLPQLACEVEFRRTKGAGIRRKPLSGKPFVIRLRSGGERLQPDARRPRRTLKNLFQEAGVPPWERDRVPMLFCGDDLVWVPGLGIDARYQAAAKDPGVLPKLLFLRKSPSRS